MAILKKSFFARDTLTVARDLIGKVLVRRDKNGKETAFVITEVEAYVGPHDLASHSSKGKTERTKVMFGPPGTWYVYFIYGMYWMLNIVTEKRGYPAAVLIRGTKEVSGPGRLKIRKTPRIGVSYAGPVWSAKPYRFLAITKATLS